MRLCLDVGQSVSFNKIGGFNQNNIEVKVCRSQIGDLDIQGDNDLWVRTSYLNKHKVELIVDKSFKIVNNSNNGNCDFILTIWKSQDDSD